MNITQIGAEKIIVDGMELPPLPKKFNCSSIYTENFNLYWNGYKYIWENKEWKWSFYGWLRCFL